MYKLPPRTNKIAYDLVIFFIAIAIFGLLFAIFEYGLSAVADTTNDMYDFSEQTVTTSNNILSIYTLLPFFCILMLSAWGIIRAIMSGGERYV